MNCLSIQLPQWRTDSHTKAKEPIFIRNQKKTFNTMGNSRTR